MRIYVGWDPRDVAAYEVCAASVRKHASVDVDIRPLLDWKLRAAGFYWRSCKIDETGQCFDQRDSKPFSTQFSFTRFCVPILAREDSTAPDWVLFCDPDMLFRADIAALKEYCDPAIALYCVKHDHEPSEKIKGTGLQTLYHRKNWSSFMWINVRHPAHENLTRYKINNRTGAWLHALSWLTDDLIGDLPVEWNWLEGWSDPNIKPNNVHFTRGTPDMPGYESVPFAEEWRDTLTERAAQPPFFVPLNLEI